jgi:hypothetical protein
MMCNASVDEHIGFYNSICPVCNKKFSCGWFHPADQKLYCHMNGMVSKGGRGKSAYRALLNTIDWETDRWRYL